MEISGISTGVIVDTAVKSVDRNLNNEIDKDVKNVSSQVDTESTEAVSEASENVGNNINVQV